GAVPFLFQQQDSAAVDVANTHSHDGSGRREMGRVRLETRPLEYPSQPDEDAIRSCHTPPVPGSGTAQEVACGYWTSRVPFAKSRQASGTCFSRSAVEGCNAHGLC